MACANSPFFISFLILLIALATIFTSLPYTLGLESGSERRRDEIGGRRILLSFRETPEGGNVTYECSPSGPCVPCAYSEKNDERYRCSATGYRIPFKCVEIKKGSRGKNSKKSQNSRLTIENVDALLHDAEVTTPVRHGRLLDDSSKFEGSTQAYITYRSCIPAVNEEKLSILGFEGIIMFLLLISGSVIYLRQKRTVALRIGAGIIMLRLLISGLVIFLRRMRTVALLAIGAVRIQTNSSLFITAIGAGIIMFLLLISGYVIYLRRKQNVALAGIGAVRIQTNSRF